MVEETDVSTDGDKEHEVPAGRNHRETDSENTVSPPSPATSKHRDLVLYDVYSRTQSYKKVTIHFLYSTIGHHQSS